MENKKSRNLIAAAIAITAAAVIVLLVAGFAAAETDYEPTGWVLKAYGNSVALYNGDEIKAIYGEVELDNCISHPRRGGNRNRGLRRLNF